MTQTSISPPPNLLLAAPVASDTSTSAPCRDENSTWAQLGASSWGLRVVSGYLGLWAQPGGCRGAPSTPG